MKWVRFGVAMGRFGWNSVELEPNGSRMPKNMVFRSCGATWGSNSSIFGFRCHFAVPWHCILLSLWANIALSPLRGPLSFRSPSTIASLAPSSTSSIPVAAYCLLGIAWLPSAGIVVCVPVAEDLAISKVSVLRSWQPSHFGLIRLRQPSAHLPACKGCVHVRVCASVCMCACVRACL